VTFAVLTAAGTLIDVQDGTSAGQLGFDKAEASWDRALAEQAFAGAENHGELPDAQRIDDISLEQGLEEVAASVDLNLSAVLRLELRDLLGNLALEQDAVAPVTLSSVREATNLGRVLSALAILSVGSDDLGQEPAKIS
jgi:hypothetical protein